MDSREMYFSFRSASRPASSRTRCTQSSTNTIPSPTAAPPLPRPGTVIFLTVPSATSRAKSLSVSVLLLLTACKCARVTIGGIAFLNRRTSDVRSLPIPAPRSGTSSKARDWMYRTRPRTSWRTFLTARVATRPVSSRRCSLSAALVLRALLVGLLRWRFAKGEEDCRRRRGFVGALGMLLERW